MKKIAITKVALDMDGVIANFCKAAAQSVGREYPKEPFAVPDMWFDMVTNNLWQYCQGHDFWANLEPFPWKNEIIKIVENNCNDWRFITKPSHDPGCYSGKYEWIRKHTKNGISKLWMANGSKAYACTGKHHLLIDDNEKNCREWEEAGGTVFRWTEISANWPQEKVNKRLDDLRNLFINGV